MAALWAPDPYFPYLGKVVLLDSQICMYSYDGTTWEALGCPPQGNRPPARTGFVLANDPLQDRLVLFGGMSSDGAFLNDTWEHDGQQWYPQHPPTSPPARAWATATADASGVTLVGGFDGALYADIWRYEAGDWRHHSPWTPVQLPAGSTVYHNGQQRAVVVTYDRQQWSFDGTT